MHLAARGELFRDLEAGVAAADHEHAALGDVRRPAVPGAVRLEDLVGEAVGECRHVRHLERACGHDDLIGQDPLLARLEHERVALPCQRADRARERDRQLEVRGVPLEVGDDLVARRVSVRVAGEGEPRQRVVAARREEDERVPAAPPGGTDGVRGFDDHEPSALLGEKVPDGEAGLARADHDDVVALVVHYDPFLVDPAPT